MHMQPSSTIKHTDEYLDHCAAQYHQCPKLRTRITFQEFMERPEYYIERADSLPEREWSVDFTKYGSHKKMWVNNMLNGETLDVQVVRCNEYQKIIGMLDKVAAKGGYPNGLLIELNMDLNTCFETATVRAWARIHDIVLLNPRTDRPQLIDSFGAEVVG